MNEQKKLKIIWAIPDSLNPEKNVVWYINLLFIALAIAMVATYWRNKFFWYGIMALIIWRMRIIVCHDKGCTGLDPNPFAQQ